MMDIYTLIEYKPNKVFYIEGYDKIEDSELICYNFNTVEDLCNAIIRIEFKQRENTDKPSKFERIILYNGHLIEDLTGYFSESNLMVALDAVGSPEEWEPIVRVSSFIKGVLEAKRKEYEAELAIEKEKEKRIRLEKEALEAEVLAEKLKASELALLAKLKEKYETPQK